MKQIKNFGRGEAAENFDRKDFTHSEAVSIKRDLEPEIKEAAKERMLSGKFRCSCGEIFDIKVWHCPNCDHHWDLDTDTCKNCYKKQPLRKLREGRADEVVAAFTGFSARSLDKADAIVKAGAMPVKQKKIPRKVSLALQRRARMMAVIRSKPNPNEDDIVLLNALDHWLFGHCSIDEKLGLTPAARKVATRDFVEDAALELSGSIAANGNDLLGSVGAKACWNAIHDYFHYGRWKADQHLNTPPKGSDGAAWILLKNNRDEMPSISKLRRIHIKTVELDVANLSGKSARRGK